MGVPRSDARRWQDQRIADRPSFLNRVILTWGLGLCLDRPRSQGYSNTKKQGRRVFNGSAFSVDAPLPPRRWDGNGQGVGPTLHSRPSP